MIKAVIFDFFGVVGQSTYQLIAERHSLNTAQINDLTDLHKSFDNGYINEQDFMQSYADILGISYEQFMDDYYDSGEKFHTSHAVLAYAKELRISYKTALLSNVGESAHTKFIQPIESFFDVVVTSHQVGLAKPETAIFELTASRLGMDVSECVMIDDSLTNCQGAISAGMQAILFTDISNLKDNLDNLVKY
jgi:epoxide hydrolase-like predicted phosphatase